MLSDENLGDILLTKEFSSYVNEKNFKTVFCRKSDPESKGKIENVVKYIKYNFLRGRTFTSRGRVKQIGFIMVRADSKRQRTCRDKEDT